MGTAGAEVAALRNVAVYVQLSGLRSLCIGHHRTYSGAGCPVGDDWRLDMSQHARPGKGWKRKNPGRWKKVWLLLIQLGIAVWNHF